MQTLADFVRAMSRPGAMSRPEMWRRAKEAVAAIDDETGSRTAHSARVERLYKVGCDIQEACHNGAKDITVHGIIKFLMLVLARSYGIGAGARA